MGFSCCLPFWKDNKSQKTSRLSPPTTLTEPLLPQTKRRAAMFADKVIASLIQMARASYELSSDVNDWAPRYFSTPMYGNRPIQTDLIFALSHFDLDILKVEQVSTELLQLLEEEVDQEGSNEKYYRAMSHYLNTEMPTAFPGARRLPEKEIKFAITWEALQKLNASRDDANCCLSPYSTDMSDG